MIHSEPNIGNGMPAGWSANRLSGELRASAAEQKYAEAIALYASTSLPLTQVAELAGVTASGLSAHIGRHHRPLLYARYGIDPSDPAASALKVKPPKGQSLRTHLKYKDAIEACGDVAYIELNVSQVARLFGLDGTALASQLRVHYPDVIPAREKLRQRLGLADNTHRGPRPASVAAYKDAVEMYSRTDMTIPEVAEKYRVSKGGLARFLHHYHKDVIEAKANRRKGSMRGPYARRAGELSGNGSLYGPKHETVALYADALSLYRNTGLTIDEIIAATGVPAAGFKGYLHQWRRGDKLVRRGCAWDGQSQPDLQGTKAFLKSASEKYAPAIASLRANPRSLAEAASEFGLNPDVFRAYLKTHAPDLAASLGMTRLANGKVVKRSSAEKYDAAVREFATTPAPLKEIAKRHGLVYNSLFGYVRRNCAQAIEKHRKITENTNRAIN